MASLLTGQGVKQSLRARAKAVRGKPGQPPFKGSKQFTGIDAPGSRNARRNRVDPVHVLGPIKTALS